MCCVQRLPPTSSGRGLLPYCDDWLIYFWGGRGGGRPSEGSKGSLTPSQQAKVLSGKCLLALCETGDPLLSAGRPDCSCWARTLDFPPNWTNSHITMEWQRIVCLLNWDHSPKVLSLFSSLLRFLSALIFCCHWLLVSFFLWISECIFFKINPCLFSLNIHSK